MDLHAEILGAAVVGVDQRLAAAHEEGIGARQVQRAGERWLEAHAVLAHPGTTRRRGADGEPGEAFARIAARDLEQVLPELLFRIGLAEHVLRLIVHTAQTARALRTAA